jgi:hypothetical protein
MNFGFTIFDYANVVSWISEIKQELTDGRNYLADGRILAVIGEDGKCKMVKCKI